MADGRTDARTDDMRSQDRAVKVMLQAG